MTYDLTDCTLCPRKCHANRASLTTGAQGKRPYCGQSDEVKVARVGLHRWEEPPISGERGSGTVFFCGCSLRCVYCQNFDIAHGNLGHVVTLAHLAKLFLWLQNQGAHNINLVTPTHFAPQIAKAIDIARESGLTLPIVCNTSGYETPETLAYFKGKVDIYLTDFKYASTELAKRYSNAPDYFEVAAHALDEMFSQVGAYSEDPKTGLLKSGVIVRHLMLPQSISDSKEVMRILANKHYARDICVSIMNQYTPFAGIGKKFPELAGKVDQKEYEELVDYALALGLANSFYQIGETARKSFIPNFSEPLPI